MMPAQVRLAASKPDSNGKRHLVLRTDASNQSQIMTVVRRHILGRDAEGRQIVPVVRHRGTDMLVLFSLRYLDRVAMAFPDATLSAGLRRRLLAQAAEEIAGQPVPDVQIPNFSGDLYPFQKQGVATCIRHLEADGAFMLNDEMGLGKTIQALAVAIKMKKKRVLVVTTKSGTGSWAKILRALFPKVKYVIVEGTHAQREAAVANNVVRITLVNFAALRGQMVDANGQPWKKMIAGKPNPQRPRFNPVNPVMFNTRWDMLIVDEFHKCKSIEAQQTMGLLSLPRTNCELFMSGTPFLNQPLELFPTLHRLYPQIYKSYWAMEQNLTVKEGNRVIGYNPDEMIKLRDFLKAHSLRRRKDQVGIQMPKVIYSQRLVELTPEQRRLYNKIKQEFKLLLADGTIKNIAGALPQITRLKQACISPELYGGTRESAKINELKDIVAELVASGEKAIIFSQYEEACQIYAEELAEYNPAYVTGSVTGYVKVDGVRQAKRDVQVDKFMKDDSCHLYIGTIDANQEAISLGKATYVIFTDKAWTPLANAQAVARSAAGGLRGVGVDVPVNVIELFAEDTFEQRIDDILNYKQGLFDRMVETDGGRIDTRRKVKGGNVTLRDLREALAA